MKNKNLHSLISCFGSANEGFYETRLCLDKPKEPAGQEAPKSDAPDAHVEHVKPAGTSADIEAEKKKKEEGVAKEADKEKKELKVGVQGVQQREAFRETERLPERGREGARTMETEEGKAPRKEREITPVEINKMPEKPVWSMDQFLKIDLKDERDKLDRWRINITRENYQINAQKWDHSTPEGLQKIYDDLKVLGIIDSSPDFYNTMFPVLRGAADEKKPWLGLDNGKYRPMFKNPTDGTSRDEIARLDKDGVFLGGEAFIKAYDHLQYIRAQVLIAQDKAQLETLSKQRKLDEDPVADKVTGFVRDNVAAFQKSIRERDWATAGMYAVGIYAMYKTLGGLFGEKGGHDDEHGGGGFGKYLLWGAAIYVGHTFLKNAGYDVLKMAGFKDANYDVKDTPMASLSGILGQSEYSEQMKDLDYGMVLRMSDTKLTTLQELFERSNKNGIQFIHPREFPEIFPNLKNVWPFKMGIGEQGLKDYIGMSTTKLGPNEKEYISVGQQIYKLALAMRVTYDNTLHKDHEKYRGMTYEEALKYPILSQSKVRHLMEAASDYAPGRIAEGLFSAKKRDEIEAQLNQDAFGKMPQEGFHLTEELGPGHFAGKLKDFPIVVVAEPDTFRIYLRNEYGKTYNRNPGRNYITKIPLVGDDKELKAKEAVNGVKKRVEKLLEPFSVDGRSIVGSTLVYQGGKWQAKVTLPGAPKFDITERETVAIITPDEFGDGVALQTEGGVRINVKESLDKQYPVALALIPKIVDQKEFRALAVFNNAGLLRLEDTDSNDNKVTLVIGRNRMKVEIEYAAFPTFDASGNLGIPEKSFVIVPPVGQKSADIEKSLVQNPAFAQEYIEALDEDEHFELNKNIQTLRDLIQKSAPEGFVKYFLEALFQQTANSPLDGINLDALSGSIPDYFTDMVLQTSKTEVMERLRRAITHSSTLDQVETARKEILQDFNDRLQGLNRVLAEENARIGREGGAWDRDIFMARVIDRVRKAGCISNAYAFEKSDFEYMVYSLPLPGFLTGKSDLSSASHKAAADLMGVFAYYTAHLDNHEYPPGSGKILNLDALTYPPVPTPNMTDITKDPALRGHLIIRYFEYVKNQIYNKANAKGDLSSVPPASAVSFWDIKEFDQWAREDGDYRTLDPLDSKPAFVHDPDVAHKPDAQGKIKFTELETAIVKEFDDAVDFLRVEYGTDLNFHAVNDYLRLKAKDAGLGGRVGLFRLQKDPITGKDTAQVWQWADTIGGLKRRSQQVQQIQGLVDKFLIQHIFENPEEFFTRPISLKARILRRWPYLRDIPLVPNWINPLN